MNKLNEISFESFTEIIGNDSERNQEQEWFSENIEYYSKLPNDSCVWDYNAYIRRLNSLVSSAGLDANFELEELIEPELIRENNVEYLVKYRICISNLIIQCGFGGNALLHQLGMDEKAVEGSNLSKDVYKGGIYLQFNNVIFSQSKKNGNHYCQFVLGSNARIDFEKCVFRGVDLYLSAQEECNYVYFRDTKFDNRHITIAGGSVHERRTGHGSNDYSISPEIIAKKAAAKRLTRKINEDEKSITYSGLLKSISEDSDARTVDEYLEGKIRANDVNVRDILFYLVNADQRIEVDQNDVSYSREKVAVISFRSCEIVDARIGGQKIYFVGKNSIEKVSNISNAENVYFGPYNILDKKGLNVRHHRPMFVARKEYATKTNDRALELISNRELLRIERHILREERGSSFNILSPALIDSFVLWFNDKINDFGMNWFFPVSLIFITNLAFSIILFCGLGYELDLSPASIFNTIGMYMELLIPTNRVETVLGNRDLNSGWEGLSIIKNILTSIFLYQAVVAFRKYGKK